MLQEDFDIILKEHFENLPKDYIDNLRDSFLEKDIIVIDKFLPRNLYNLLKQESKKLLEDLALRKDLIMPGSGNTPRHFNTVGRNAIASDGNIIPLFFNSEVVLNVLSKINGGKKVYRLPYEPEEFLIINQQSKGDTHGWHWDDYTFALIWIIEAPKIGDGALVEYIPKTRWDKEDPENCVQKVLDANEVTSLYVPEGHCYFMNAKSSLHRVSPLTGDSHRTVVVYGFATEEEILNRDITHESVEAIW
ncbi:HalD/BesD family halogenase [Bacillus cereus]|uniref:HalD/BesD family halogenase n=1 Tax=Bacillus cereus TaxID=1396 RepID=UPI001374E14F|nr:hypothetical protein [Bacillus cereus]